MKVWFTKFHQLRNGRMYDKQAENPTVPLTREQLRSDPIYQVLVRQIRDAYAKKPDHPVYREFLDWFDESGNMDVRVREG